MSDGDTITILDKSNKQHKIRLAKIDAPETTQDFGSASKKNLSNLCYKKNAIAKVETIDRYNRAVAVVYCDNIEANIEQVKNGLAWVYRQYTNDKRYYEAEKLAKSQKIGIWSVKDLMPAWEYRRNRKNFNDKQTQSKEQHSHKCGAKRSCSQMSSCDEAMFYLNVCNIKSLDRDNDGIPCEKLCK